MRINASEHLVRHFRLPECPFSMPPKPIFYLETAAVFVAQGNSHLTFSVSEAELSDILYENQAEIFCLSNKNKHFHVKVLII